MKSAHAGLGTARWWRGIVAFMHPRTGGAHDSHHRTAGIAGRTWRRGCRVAARGAGAAGGDAGDRVSQRLVTRGPNTVCDRISPRHSRDRLCRGPEPGDRVSLGAGPIRSLPDFAADLVRRQVTVIAAHDTPSSIVA